MSFGEKPICSLACCMVQSGDYISLHRDLLLRIPSLGRLIEDRMDDGSKAVAQILKAESTQVTLIPCPCPFQLLSLLSATIMSLQSPSRVKGEFTFGPESQLSCELTKQVPCLSCWGMGRSLGQLEPQLHTTKEGPREVSHFSPNCRKPSPSSS